MKKLLLILPVFVLIVVFSGCREAEKEQKSEYIRTGRIFDVYAPVPYWSTQDTSSGNKELEDDRKATPAARRAKIHGDEAFTGRIILERRRKNSVDDEFIRWRTRDIDIEEAAEYYILAYDLGWSDYLLVFRIGWCLQRTEPERAAKYFRMANDMYKKQNGGKVFFDAVFSNAACYMLMQKYLDTKGYAEDVTKVNYKLFKDDDNKGKTTADKVVTTKGAISLFTELIKMQPKYRLAYYDRAVCYYNTGFYKEAYEDIRRFADMTSGDDKYAKSAYQLKQLCEKELRIK